MSKIVRLIVVAVLIGILFFYFQYNKPHRNIAEASVFMEVSVDDIYTEFVVDESEAYQKYHDKVVVLSGKVAFVDDSQEGQLTLLLEKPLGKANCQLSMEEKPGFWKKKVGKNVKIKGLFVGFDDLIGEVQLKECSYYQ